MTNPIFDNDFQIFDFSITNDSRYFLIICGQRFNPTEPKYRIDTIEIIGQKEVIFEKKSCPENHFHIFISNQLLNPKEQIGVLVNGNIVKYFSVNKYPDLKDKVVLSTMVRNEENFVEDWINFHKRLGIEHFIFYDDSGEEKLEKKLHETQEKNIFTVINWHREIYDLYQGVDKLLAFSKQPIHQNHTLYNFRDCKIIGFFDIDEYVNPQTDIINIERLVTETNTKFNLNPQEIGGYELKCRFFLNTENKDDSPNHFLNITECAKEFCDNSHQKLFILPKNVELFSVHQINVGKNKFCIPLDLVYFNHYIFLNKKGNGDCRSNRGFFKETYDQLKITKDYDDTMIKLRKKIE